MSNNTKLDARPSSVALTPEDLTNISLANRYAEAIEEDADLESISNSRDTSTSEECHYTQRKRISLAKPEPETSYDKSLDGRSSFEKTSSSSSYSEYDYLVAKFKKLRSIFFGVMTGLTVALLGCIIGIVIMKCLPHKSSALSKEHFSHELNASHVTETNEIEYDIDDPWRIHQYPSVNSNERDIAEVFADHTLYQMFYGITYNGPNPDFYPMSSSITNNQELTSLAKRDEREASSYEIQHQISVDMALLSRVTTRVRLFHSSFHRLVERVLQALVELNLNLTIHLSVSAARWEKENSNVREVINSAPANLINAIYLEHDADEDTTFRAHIELEAFLTRRRLADSIELSIVEPQRAQANPLDLSENEKLAVSFLNSDEGRRIYTNLETSSETSEKARSMSSWVCEIAPNLRYDIEWFWSNSFDDNENVLNGIFSYDRTLKPAGLPRCSA